MPLTSHLICSDFVIERNLVSKKTVSNCLIILQENVCDYFAEATRLSRPFLQSDPSLTPNHQALQPIETTANAFHCNAVQWRRAALFRWLFAFKHWLKGWENWHSKNRDVIIVRTLWPSDLINDMFIEWLQWDQWMLKWRFIYINQFALWPSILHIAHWDSLQSSGSSLVA